MKAALLRMFWLAGLALLLAGCASGPRAPDWQVDARASAQRYVDAYLSGSRVHEAEWQRLREALSATAEPARLARAELLRCALAVASLHWPASCEGWERLRSAASPQEQAYAQHLLGRWTAESAAQLPLPQRRVAERGAAALAGIEDPLSRLLGAAVLLRSGRVTEAERDGLVALAVDTASAQGWRRPLMAWLLLQQGRAQAQGRSAEAERIGQRLQVLEGR